MAKAKALIDYVKIKALVSLVEDDVKIVADVFPRIRAVIHDYVDIRVEVKGAPYIISFSIWDGGDSIWDDGDSIWDAEA